MPRPDIRTRVVLQTRDGHVVHRGWMPPFKPPPDVVTWGTRTFVRYPETVTEHDLGAETYREVMAVALVE